MELCSRYIHIYSYKQTLVSDHDLSRLVNKTNGRLTLLTVVFPNDQECKQKI